MAVVTAHTGDLKIDTLKGILEDAKITDEQLRKML